MDIRSQVYGLQNLRSRLQSSLQTQASRVALEVGKHKFAVVCLGIGLGIVLVGLQTQTNPPQASVVTTQICPDSSPIASAPQKSQLVVSVSGSVLHPGVYALEEGSRVADAVASAGGFLKKANWSWINKELNLAQKVRDEMMVFVPMEGDGGLAQQPTNNSQQTTNDRTTDQQQTPTQTLVHINSATLTELMTLKGIGEVKAQKIIDARPFASVDDFRTRLGLSESFAADNADLYTVP